MPPLPCHVEGCENTVVQDSATRCGNNDWGCKNHVCNEHRMHVRIPDREGVDQWVQLCDECVEAVIHLLRINPEPTPPPTHPGSTG